jgi:hypothetical protein
MKNIWTKMKCRIGGKPQCSPLHRYVLCFCLLILLSGSSITQESELLIIGSADLDGQTLSDDEVIRIFQGTSRRVGSTTISGIIFLEDSNVHQQFLKRFIHKSDVSFRNYWKRRVFTGKNSMPRYFDSEDAVVEYVRNHRNVIAYISENTNHEGVVVVNRTK